MKANTNIKEPLVSVLIPVYNCEKYLEQAIDSIINQTYKNLEILIIDDASTDNSLNILMNYANKDKRIKIFKNKENEKIVNALNFLISQATGAYIVRMDGDDISALNRIEKQVKYLQDHPNVYLCGSNIYYIDDYGKKIRKSHFPISNNSIQGCKYFRTPFVHASIMINSIIKDQIVYSNDYIYAEDYALWLELLEKKYRAINLKECYYKYRIYSTQTTQTKNDKQIESLYKLYKKYLGKLLNDEQIYDLCKFVVLRKIHNKTDFMKIVIKINQFSTKKLTIYQCFVLLKSIMACKKC